tara:strand:+ start:10339 stop:11529 length:1191 start_codon:yes stop_codon:yes gene_type:complete
MDNSNLEDLLVYASDRQREQVNAVISEGTQAKAAKKLGINIRTLERNLQSLRQTASKDMVSSLSELGLPDGCTTEKISVNLDANGKPKQVWVKGKKDPAVTMLMFQKTIDIWLEHIKPTRKKTASHKTKAEKRDTKDLMNVYTISDFHLGMLAWHKEGGDDWDLEKAKKILISAFKEMILRSPKSDSCIINQLGDLLHSDGFLPVTPLSGHVLDQDTRFDKLIETALELMIEIIELCLDRHEKVHLICAEGNHDITSSKWLRHAFNKMYSKEPRVSVDTNPQPFYIFEHGRTLLGFHHGHKVRNASRLVSVFSSDPKYRPAWGRSVNTYIHTGHLHSEKREDVSGALVVQHPTLAARDAYASSNGYNSMRGCIAFTYHKEFGEVSSVNIKPASLNL